ncbi:MAG: hypothetical protein PHE06_14470, partial [Lachnospiraceae bacterium]|nr:hypothetical protein [Lachnospiraceae bacterium]
DIKADDWKVMMEQETLHTGQRVCSGIRVTGKELEQGKKPAREKQQESFETQREHTGPAVFSKEEKKAVLSYRLELRPGKTIQIQRRVCNLVWKPEEHSQCVGSERAGGQFKKASARPCNSAGGLQLTGGSSLAELYQEKCNKMWEFLETGDFEEILEENRKWWQEIWEKCDIEIYGDSANQQGIRFCIFQMFQTYHGAVKGSNIGAKGLTGEAYNGNAFWDTETYCLPFYLFHDQKAAENLLYFRYQTLDEARKRAAQLDCRGAFYPIATISGRECCNLWQHASLQLQASTAVAYGIWFYEKMTGNLEFLKNQVSRC